MSQEGQGMAGRIGENLRNVLRRIAEAAQRAGRRPEEVQLVAVSKTRSPEEIAELIHAGQRLFGENRVQELARKLDALEPETESFGLEWHFVGHLQTNKARVLVGRVRLIHGVDSLHLAEALQRAAEKRDCTVDCLLEISVSGESSKFGIAPAEVGGVVAALRPFDRVHCLGLMTMAPWDEDPEAARPVFRGLREIRDRIRSIGHPHADLRHLSMGMTHDFEIAIEEGATLVRIGTALFEQ